MIAHPFATDDLSRLAPPPGMQLWYSATDAAKLLGCHRVTVHRRMIAREIPWSTVHGQRRIHWSDLLAYVERGRRGELDSPLPKPVQQTKKEALPLARKRTQTRNLRSSARNQKR